MQLGLSFAGGALSGGVLNLGTGAVNFISNYNINKSAKEIGKEAKASKDFDMNELVEEGLKTDKDSSAHKLAEEVNDRIKKGKKVDDADTGNLIKAVVSENLKTNQSESVGSGNVIMPKTQSDKYGAYAFGKKNPNGVTAKDRNGDTVVITGLEQSARKYGERGNTVVFNTAEGKKINADEITFSEQKFEELKNNAHLFDTNGARLFIAEFEEYEQRCAKRGVEVDMFGYLNDFERMYSIGRTGASFESVKNNKDYKLHLENLGNIARYAYNAGKNDMSSVYAHQANRLLEVVSENGALKDPNAKVYVENGTVADINSDLMQALQSLADKVGRDIIISDRLGDRENGKYSNGRIYINSEIDENKILSVAIHEAGHSLKVGSPALFKELADFVSDYLTAHKLDVNEMTDKVIEAYGGRLETREGESVRDAAYEEVVCNALMSIAADENALSKAVNTDPSKLKKIAEALKRIVQKIKEYFSNGNASYAGKAFSKDINALNTLAEKFSAAADNARQNVTDNGTYQNGNAVEVEKYSIADVRSDSGKIYKNVVILDTNIFKGYKPRNWGKVLRSFIFNNLINKKITVFDENGDSMIIEFAKKNERVQKDGANNSHKVIDKLARKTDNISRLAVAHADEIIEVSEYENDKNEHTHQWLDENGWQYRTTYLMDKNGDIYTANLNVAKAKDGRNILYDINNQKNIGHGVVPSSAKSKRGSHINPDVSTGNISHNKTFVNDKLKKDTEKFSIEIDSEGDKVVVINTNKKLFANVDDSDVPKIAREYVVKHFKGTTLPFSEYGLVRVGKKGIDKYFYSGNKYDKKMYIAKSKAATELNNLLEASEYLNWEEDKKQHGFARNGFEYFKTVFIVDNQIFEAIIDIGYSENGIEFYGMSNIKRVTTNSGKYVSLVLNNKITSESKVSGNSYKENISQYSNTVNDNLIKDTEKLSIDNQEDENDIISDIRYAIDDEYNEVFEFADTDMFEDDSKAEDIEKLISEDPDTALPLIYNAAANTVLKGIKAGKSIELSNKALNKVVNKAMNDYHIDKKINPFCANELAESIKTFAEDVKVDRKGFVDAFGKLVKSCRSALLLSGELDRSFEDLRNNVRNEIKGKNLVVPEYDEAQIIEDFGSLEKFRKIMFGHGVYVKYKSKNSSATGMSIFEIGEHLRNAVGEFITNNAELEGYEWDDSDGYLMLERLVNDVLAPKYVNHYVDGFYENIDIAAVEMAFNISGEYLQQQGEQYVTDSKADRKTIREMNKAANTAKKEYRALLKAKNEKYNAEFEKQKRTISELRTKNKNLNLRNQNQKKIILNGTKTIREQYYSERNKVHYVNAFTGLCDRVLKKYFTPKPSAYVPYEVVEALAETMQLISQPKTMKNGNITEKAKQRLEILNNLSKLSGTLDKYAQVRESGKVFENDYYKAVAENRHNITGRDFSVNNVDLIKTQIDKLYDFWNKPENSLKITISDFASDEVQTIYEIFRNVEMEIAYNQKIVLKGKEYNAYEISEQISAELNEVKGTRLGDGKAKWVVRGTKRLIEKYQNEMNDPIRFARRITGYKKDSKFVECMEELNEGQTESQILQKVWTDKCVEVFEKYRDKELKNFKTKGMYNIGGFEITRDMAVEMLLEWEDEHGKAHIINQGYLVPNLKYIKRVSKNSLMYEKDGVAGILKIEGADKKETIALWTKEMMKLKEFVFNDKLSKDVYDLCRQLYQIDMQKAVNKVALDKYGYEIALVKKYCPLTIDDDTVHKNFADVLINRSINSRSFLHQREGTGRLKLMGALDKLGKQIDSVSSWCGMTIPIEGFSRVYNMVSFDPNMHYDGKRVEMINGIAQVVDEKEARVFDVEKYSLEENFESLDSEEIKAYNNRGWSYGLFTNEDMKLLQEKFSELSNKRTDNVLRDGTRIEDINNKLVLIGGTFEDPQVHCVLVINADNETYAEFIKDEVYYYDSRRIQTRYDFQSLLEYVGYNRGENKVRVYSQNDFRYNKGRNEAWQRAEIPSNFKNYGYTKQYKRGAGDSEQASRGVSELLTDGNKGDKYSVDVEAEENKALSKVKYFPSVKESIKSTWGSDADKYISKLMGDLQGAGKADVSQLDILTGRYISAKLLANVSSAIKQVCSIPLAASVTGFKPVLRVVKHIRPGKHIPLVNKLLSEQYKHEVPFDELAKYTPILWYRQHGNNNRDISEINKYKGFGTPGGIKKVVSDKMNLLESVDNIMVQMNYWICYEYVSKELNINPESKDFMPTLAKTLETIMNSMMPNGSTMQQGQVLRRDNSLVKVFTVCKSQVFCVANSVMDATGEWGARHNDYKKACKTEDEALIKSTLNDLRKSRKKASRTITASIVSAVMMAGINQFVNLLLARWDSDRDDDGLVTSGAVTERMISDFISELSGNLLFGSEIYELVEAAITKGKYFAPSVGGLESVTNLVSDLLSVYNKMTGDNGNVTDINPFLNLVGDIGDLTGLPADNCMKIGRAISNHIKNSLYYGFTPAVGNKGTVKTSTYAATCYNALLDGNKELYETYKNQWLKETKSDGGNVDEDYIKSQLKKHLLANTDIIAAAHSKLSYNLDSYESVVYKYTQLGFSEKIVVSAIDSVVKQLDPPETEEKEPEKETGYVFTYADLYEAYDSGNSENYNTVYNYLINEGGKTSKDIQTAIKRHLTKLRKQQ